MFGLEKRMPQGHSNHAFTPRADSEQKRLSRLYRSKGQNTVQALGNQFWFDIGENTLTPPAI